jgi:uncharacterized protein (DUF697 family)/GTP-binding protein EngB required for normal cell division
MEKPSWVGQAADAWQGAWQGLTAKLRQGLPIDRAAQTAMGWFSVDEAQVSEILHAVRSQLPTTEVLMLGKPQVGKSSIVRGLTGVSPDIIGQGFRPHTQHTERYAYPSDELPLLIFTDTVGFGDSASDPETTLQELLNDLQQETQGARILILVVKVTDFAVDALKQIAERLRQKHPEIPCVLAITCLHELYPQRDGNHPEYPPTYPELERAAQAIQDTFAGCFDRTVWIDFTLEDDGYQPLFYGIEALQDTLAACLPEAEARTLYQLLDEQHASTEQLGNLYREVGRHYIAAYAVIAATVAAVPLPFATMPVLTALQVTLILALGRLYGRTLTFSQAGGIISTIAGGFVAQTIGRELVKFIPGLGSAIAASWAAAYTWALGEGACVYFGDLMGGKKPDAKRIQAAMAEGFTSAQQRLKGSTLE